MYRYQTLQPVQLVRMPIAAKRFMCYYTYLVQHTTHYTPLIQRYAFNYLVSVDKEKTSKYNLTCHRQGIALFECQETMGTDYLLAVRVSPEVT